MSSLYKVGMVIFVSIGIAWLLSYLPELDQLGKSNDHIVTVGSAQPIELSDNNIVDHLIDLKLRGQISKVDWSHGILVIDLRSERSPQKREDILDDMVSLTRFSFVETTNVKQVLIRVLATDEQTKTSTSSLLLALDGKRDQWLNEQWQQRARNEITSEYFLQFVFLVDTNALDQNLIL